MHDAYPYSPQARGVRPFEQARAIGACHWEFHWTFAQGDAAFEGHFPHQPILPGVFLVEMAQRAAEYALNAETQARHRVRKVERFRFLNPVLPGDGCRLRVEWQARSDAGTQLQLTFDKAGVAIAHGVMHAQPESERDA